MQVERPVTLKKDGIQTRNRKLSQRSKKKKGGGANMVDFFRSGLVDARYGYGGGGSGGGMMSAAGMGHHSHLMGGGGGGPMSGYYHQIAPMTSSPFMQSGMGSMYMSSMSASSHGGGGGGLSPHSHAAAFSLGGSPGIPAGSIVAGATA